MAKVKAHTMESATEEETGVLLSELTEAEITPEERYQMIEEAAYYRAQQRGFHGNEHLRDWLEAEAIIDSLLRRAVTPQEEKSHNTA